MIGLVNELQKDLEGSDRGLTEVLSRHLPRVTEVTYAKPQSQNNRCLV
jgi:hypothetical protein